MDKLQFLQHDLITLLKTLPANAKGEWGLMNAQQMVEHLIDSVQVGNGKKVYACITPEDRLPAVKAFMLSEKPFKQNSRNALVSEIPPPVHYPSMEAAIKVLETEMQDFVTFFKNDPGKILLNPIFGDLNYEEWLYLFYKHAHHHLRQFGLVE